MSSKIVTVENLTNIRTTIIIHIFNFIVCFNFKGQKISKANYLVLNSSKKQRKIFCSRFFSDVSHLGYLGETESLAGNSKPIYVVDAKSEKSAPMYYSEGTLLHYSMFA